MSVRRYAISSASRAASARHDASRRMKSRVAELCDDADMMDDCDDVRVKWRERTDNAGTGSSPVKFTIRYDLHTRLACW